MVKGRRLDVTYYVEGQGKRFAEAATGVGLEGVLAKRKGSKYLPGKRSSDWRKIKILNRQDCVVLGWTRGSGRRTSTFGALLVGAYDGELKWIGQVGTGFTDRMLEDLMARLEPLVRKDPPIPDPELRRMKGARFVEPQLVCEVEFLQMTSAGKLRAPSYKGLRPDKSPEDCILERPRKRR
jgi:bifunctional non-homologous end joining protein LigD